MKLTAEIIATEIIDKDETEKDTSIKLSCEGLDSSCVIVEFEDGRKFNVDGNDLMECLARISQEELTAKEEDD